MREVQKNGTGANPKRNRDTVHGVPEWSGFCFFFLPSAAEIMTDRDSSRMGLCRTGC